MDKTYVIAEIGINHNGCLETTKKLIDIASAAGFDAVKFQKRNPNVCVPEVQKSKWRDTPWGKITYLDYKHKVEFGKAEYDEIDSYCQTKEIEWSASPWDIDSARFLENYSLPWVKIASASLTDLPLLKYCARKFDKILMSTGMSVEGEMQAAHDTLSSHGAEVVVLHCNSSYPTPIEDVNLNYIKTLQEKFPNSDVGYSGHEYGLTSTICSIVLGAKYIERHVTLDKTMWGSDHMASIEPHGQFKLVRGIRDIEKALGTTSKKFTEEEKEKRETLSIK